MSGDVDMSPRAAWRLFCHPSLPDAWGNFPIAPPKYATGSVLLTPVDVDCSWGISKSYGSTSLGLTELLSLANKLLNIDAITL